MYFLAGCCRICGGCKHEIIYGNYLGCMGSYFHPQCFCCSLCRQPITESEVLPCSCSLKFIVIFLFPFKIELN